MLEKKELTEKIINYLNRSNIDYDILPIQESDQNNFDIAFCLDWNLVNNNLDSIIEKFYDIYYMDEYITCSECGKLIRSHVYNRSMNCLMADHEIFCLECSKIDLFDEVLNEYYLNDPTKCINENFIEYILELGYKKFNLDSFQSGLHEHMRAIPEKIIESIDTKKLDFVFVLDSINPFNIDFSLYTKSKRLKVI